MLGVAAQTALEPSLLLPCPQPKQNPNEVSAPNASPRRGCWGGGESESKVTWSPVTVKALAGNKAGIGREAEKLQGRPNTEQRGIACGLECAILRS